MTSPSLFSFSRTRAVSLVVATMLPTLAWAQDPGNVEAEYVRPSFGADSFAGVDVPTTTKPYTVRAGLMLMYTRDPVTLWDRLANDERGEEIGAIVGNRFSMMAGVSFDLSERVTINGLIPVAINGGADPGDPEQFAAPGIGLQDIGLGVRVTAIRSRNKKFNFGLKGSVLLPSGKADAFLGDGGFRPILGALASYEVGRTLFAAEAGVMIRPETVTTQEDFIIGSELLANVAVRHKLPDAMRMGVTGQILTKSGFSNFLQGGGENGLEGLAGIQIYPSRMVTLDFSAGRGLTQGYATTDLRILGGITVELAPKAPIPVPPVVPIPPKVIPPPVIIIDEPEVIDTPLILVTQDAIEVKQRLEFRVNTTNLLDSSRPTLKGVADYINGEWKMAHLEIVGHASEEGSYEYNYNLSQGRARTIWQELIKLGVHPDRISYKGMGEVVPRDLSKVNRELTDEELQDNRRVEFHIIKQYDELEENPFEGMESTIKAPWNGQPMRVVVPEKPVEEEPEEETGPDEFESFNLDDEDEGMEE